jgi:hypothetical protein
MVEIMHENDHDWELLSRVRAAFKQGKKKIRSALRNEIRNLGEGVDIMEIIDRLQVFMELVKVESEQGNESDVLIISGIRMQEFI